jgi:hypothetical protein
MQRLPALPDRLSLAQDSVLTEPPERIHPAMANRRLSSRLPGTAASNAPRASTFRQHGIRDRLQTAEGLWILISCFGRVPRQRFKPNGGNLLLDSVLLDHRYSERLGSERTRRIDCFKV